MNKLRIKRKIIIRTTHGKIVETTGIVPDSHICANNNCNMYLPTYQRKNAQNKGSNKIYCSRECANHQRRIDNIKKAGGVNTDSKTNQRTKKSNG